MEGYVVEFMSNAQIDALDESVVVFEIERIDYDEYVVKIEL